MPQTQADRAPAPHAQLRRTLGLSGATYMGLGAMVGTGVFVSIGIAAGIAGPAVVLAVPIAAVLAACNALSSAQLAANHPVSGGTYEYGYRLLSPSLGFTAGLMFLAAKSASAATAALGFSGYLLNTLRGPLAFGDGRVPGSAAHVAVATGVVAALTILVLGGIRRSARVNTIIVAVTLAALAVFVLAGARFALRGIELGNFSPLLAPGPTAQTDSAAAAFLHAAALMFVAFTGYGRIATMGEEVAEPRRIIPRAIILTVVVTAVLYCAVAFVAVGAVGAPVLAAATGDEAAPLEVVARTFGPPLIATIVSIGAMTAMLGVLLNLILGVSRVLLAMARRADAPRLFSRVDRTGTTPAPAVVGVGLLVGALCLLGDLRTAWSFSAFTVLIYYAITNAAALRLLRADRLYHPAVAVAGLIGCLGLAFFVETRIWIAGLVLIAVGLLVRAIARRLTAPPAAAG